ncbi:MAG: PilZ domain-containing protein [Desulfobacteraceae bacterium]|jgi:PilZ domain-containing protein|nr:PilZ domain-containing protein [Desulfobacteraceae bacterium]
MPHNERRSYVRGNFSFKIKFKKITLDEYEELVKSNGAISPHFQIEPGIDIADKKIGADTAIDFSLVNYLVLIDEKLDLILELLEKDNKIEGLFKQGIGSNISGSGMNIMVDKPFETGQIIHSKFYLSKIPLIFMDIFGEVVHSTKVDERGQTLYSLGIKFLDLSVNDQEKIIASVFQKQRGVLRKRKS